jgi:hypothetical protein
VSKSSRKVDHSIPALERQGDFFLPYQDKFYRQSELLLFSYQEDGEKQSPFERDGKRSQKVVQQSQSQSQWVHVLMTVWV